MRNEECAHEVKDTKDGRKEGRSIGGSIVGEKLPNSSSNSGGTKKYRISLRCVLLDAYLCTFFFHPIIQVDCEKVAAVPLMKHYSILRKM